MVTKENSNTYRAVRLDLSANRDFFLPRFLTIPFPYIQVADIMYVPRRTVCGKVCYIEKFAPNTVVKDSDDDNWVVAARRIKPDTFRCNFILDVRTCW